MSNPTTPFSWQMPTNTDLVTDLPADFEVFGQAVATSMQDLLGGTTGQVLAKASNADMDFVWSADAAGMTNPMTTTGDIIYSSPGSTPVRRGIGSTGQILTVAGGIPTWATLAGLTFGTTTVATRQGTTSTFNATANNGAYAGFAVSGATTIAATDDTMVGVFNGNNPEGNDSQQSAVFVVTCTAGSNTFTAKYKRPGTSGTATFGNRTLTIINLN